MKTSHAKSFIALSIFAAGSLDPEGYKGHIEHLVKQGYIVIYSQQQAYDLLVNAPSRVVCAALSDDHGCPNLTADHPAAGQPADSKTGKPEEDAIDFRYYYAALDGQSTLTFDMGQWSDGTPVKPVLHILP